MSAGRRSFLAAAATAALAPGLARGNAAALSLVAGQPRAAASPARARMVVADFLDPQALGLGQALAAFQQKDILGVAVAPEQEQENQVALPVLAGPARARLADALAREQHHAALRLLADSQARLALWGRIEALGDALLLHASVTLAPATESPELVLRVAVNGEPVSDLAAELGWTRIDFPPLALRRAQFFDRILLAGASGVELRAAPEARAAVMRSAAPGEALRLRDMRGAWYVVGDAKTPTFLDAAPRRGLAAAFRMVPARVAPAPGERARGVPDPRAAADLAAAFRMVPARVAPAPGERARGVPDPRAAADLALDPQRPVRVVAQRVAEGASWLQVESGGRRGWLAQATAAAMPELPAAHLALGLFAAMSGDAAAARHLDAFLRRPASERAPVASAAALQALAMVTLREGPDGARRPAGMALLDRAAAQTPRDPSVLALRAVARIGAGRALAAVEDLEAALALDPTWGRARALVGALRRAGDQGPPRVAEALGLRNADVRRKLDALHARAGGGAAPAEGGRRLVDDMQRLFSPPR